MFSTSLVECSLLTSTIKTIDVQNLVSPSWFFNAWIAVFLESNTVQLRPGLCRRAGRKLFLHHVCLFFFALFVQDALTRHDLIFIPASIGLWKLKTAWVYSPSRSSQSAEKTLWAQQAIQSLYKYACYLIGWKYKDPQLAYNISKNSWSGSVQKM